MYSPNVVNRWGEIVIRSLACIESEDTLRERLGGLPSTENVAAWICYRIVYA